MKLFNTYLGPASDPLLDLGATNFRWKNLYMAGSIIGPIAYTGTTITISSLNVVAENVSSLILSNSAKAYMNVKMLTHNAASILSGDIYFFASSNQVYLAIRSQNATYYVAMNT